MSRTRPGRLIRHDPALLSSSFIAVEDLERARQFYTAVLEMQELDRPEGFGHPGIWYQIGDGKPQLHILVRSEATLRRDKCTSLIAPPKLLISLPGVPLGAFAPLDGAWCCFRLKLRPKGG
jgi:catechol 2,3-dioxygenase-like lactoylglutathione lyase family enzyme